MLLLMCSWVPKEGGEEDRKKEGKIRKGTEGSGGEEREGRKGGREGGRQAKVIGCPVYETDHFAFHRRRDVFLAEGLWACSLHMVGHV
jgi:hypothetical protein